MAPTDHERGTHTAAWRRMLVEGHPAQRALLRQVMRRIPGPPRCKACQNPFGGVGGRMFRMIGLGPSRKNPQLCNMCCEKMPRGGAEVETTILFADVRGSTALAERLGPTAYADVMNRFYAVATETLIRYGATIDKLIGDEVMAFFVPGFAGPNFKESALDAGRSLLRALGYGGRDAPWLPVGVGIDSGLAFVGNIGAEHYVDFTVLGDPVNTAARIQAAADPGELLMGEAAYEAVAARFPDCPARDIPLKGTERTLRVRALPLDPG